MLASSSSFQRGSGAPLMYQSAPLSATNMPYGVELIQQEVVAVHDQHVSIAAGVTATLDGYVRWNGVRPRVTLIGILKRHWHARLIAVDDDIWDADRRALPDGAEIRVQPAVEADARDKRL